MEPAISTGSVVVIQKKDAYLEGQVVTFGAETSNSIPTTHRIVATEVQEGELVYLTKGDANEERDVEAISKEDVRGVVLFAIPALGYLLDFARQPIGFALLIGVPALVIIFEEASKIMKVVKMERVKREEEREVEADPPTKV
jgi:signal peptidase